MRDLFPGYYRPTTEQFAELWQQGIFVLDTNVLLNFYRYSPQTGGDLLEILRRVADRLWVPHQVALEYQENRLDEIAQQEDIYTRISSIFDKTQEELNVLLRRGHLSIDVDVLLSRLSSTFSEARNELNQRKQQHPNLFDEDNIRESLTTILEGKVGHALTQERLDEIYKLGEERYKLSIPPGYKDKDKKRVTQHGLLKIEEKYGDLILWYQMIEKAKEVKKSIIFITDDRKEDWWWESRGRVIGPRPELALEMRNEASVLFYMYTPDRFIEYARDNLGVPVTQAVVDEVREVAEARVDWKDELINALAALGGEARLQDIYDWIREMTSRKLPASWQDIIRYTLYIHCSESPAYRGGEDLFRRVGRGHWALKTMSEQRTGQMLDEKEMHDVKEQLSHKNFSLKNVQDLQRTLGGIGGTDAILKNAQEIQRTLDSIGGTDAILKSVQEIQRTLDSISGTDAILKSAQEIQRTLGSISGYAALTSGYPDESVQESTNEKKRTDGDSEDS